VSNYENSRQFLSEVVPVVRANEGDLDKSAKELNADFDGDRLSEVITLALREVAIGNIFSGVRHIRGEIPEEKTLEVVFNIVRLARESGEEDEKQKEKE
jgi:hypothetical protein